MSWTVCTNKNMKKFCIEVLEAGNWPCHFPNTRATVLGLAPWQILNQQQGIFFISHNSLQAQQTTGVKTALAVIKAEEQIMPYIADAIVKTREVRKVPQHIADMAMLKAVDDDLEAHAMIATLKAMVFIVRMRPKEERERICNEMLKCEGLTLDARINQDMAILREGNQYEIVGERLMRDLIRRYVFLSDIPEELDHAIWGLRCIEKDLQPGGERRQYDWPVWSV